MKILYYLRALNIGGAETFVYNVLDKIDTDSFSIDVVLQSDKNENKRLIRLCEKKHITIHYTCPFEKNYFKSYGQLLKLVETNQYDIIHYHANSLINNIPLLVARKTGCRLVVHSHNSSNNIGGLIGRSLHYLNRWILIHSNAVCLSCSDKAGKWMFGNKPYSIINNGINLDTFKFDPNSRSSLRKELSIDEETFVWGHVSRFVQAKNHKFLIACFEAYNRVYPNAKLVLLGDGPLFDDVKTSTKNENIVFLGSLQDTSKYYSMFDVMVFPSFFEGLPFVLVEAQASGLPILASDTITRLVDVSGSITYHSLNDGIDGWVESIPQKNCTDKRYELIQKMKGSEFDSIVTVQQICSKYSDK